MIVTGAASGMGETAARMFAKNGAAVMLADVNRKAVERLAAEWTKESYDVAGIRCDVSKEEDVKRMVEETVARWGRIDAAFNNAGIMSDLCETADMPLADFERVVSINLKGVWLCMKYELQQMRGQGYGKIVNSSSLGGLVGVAGRSAYIAAKHGVIGLTKTAALEYANRGICVNAVCPGTIDTPMVKEMERTKCLLRDDVLRVTPMGRYGTAEEVAQIVYWLCHPGASYVTGQAIAVDGGYTAM